jgi:hypothetical protein
MPDNFNLFGFNDISDTTALLIHQFDVRVPGLNVDDLHACA